MVTRAAKYAFFPVLFAQAVATRRRLPRLPEAGGPREGVMGDGPHEIRLLLAGDSSAAGVGVDTQEKALAGRLVQRLAERTGAAVHWRVIARSGATTAECRALLVEQERWAADVAVLALGVNDLIEQVPMRQAIVDRAQLVRSLRRRCGVRHVVFAPLPPIHQFPSLPQPLRWWAGAEARRLERAVRLWTSRHDGISHVPIEMTLDAAVMASDGFHPGEPIYKLCGDALADHVVDAVLPKWGQAGRGTVRGWPSASVAT